METNNYRVVRGKIVAELRRELMGPSNPNEELHNEFPTSRYIVGRLAPARSGDDDTDAIIDSTENDTLAIGADENEEGHDDQQVPLVIGFNPASMGLSFLVDLKIKSLKVEVSWGDYKREKQDENSRQTVWRRYPREAIVSGIDISSRKKIGPIALTKDQPSDFSVSVTGIDDPEIFIEGIVHNFSDYRAISLFLVNRRTKGELSDRSKDERWIYQPKLCVATDPAEPGFVAKDIQFRDDNDEVDGDAASSNLLYRHAQEFATGHGVAAYWSTPSEDGQRTSSVFTEYIPFYEVPKFIPPEEASGGAVLDMKKLSEAQEAIIIKKMLMPLAESYENWISEQEKASDSSEISENPQYRDASKENLNKAKECLKRIRNGIDLIASDPHVYTAFQFANKVMWDQRIHSLWAARNRKANEVSGNHEEFDFSENRTWRSFQMGFILLNILGISQEKSEDRKIVDLLWFPTGGGKTEAYLGLSAFTLALRRLRGNKYGLEAGAGVSIIMRYTLRLLTVQQFQRAAALISSCEIERRKNPHRWGEEPFMIGVWVGRGITPNTFSESCKAIENFSEKKRAREGSPVQFVTCPRCGSRLVNENGFPEQNTYIPDKQKQQTRIYCNNQKCEFALGSHQEDGIPAVVSDDEIYRLRPSLVVATVDKFARMPFKGETQGLFGYRDRFSPTYGHLTPAHHDKIGGRAVRDEMKVPRLFPPELIIQDELHLISGPLGTMVGLYESAVDFVTTIDFDSETHIQPKVIASTATIRRAHQQVRQLYNRKLNIFPSAGTSAKDSFFSRELTVDENIDDSEGRLFIGLNAPGSSTKTLLVRVYSVLLAASQAEINNNQALADPYSTLVGYFNSLRALGGAKRLVEDDIRLTRLKYLEKQREFPRRTVPVSEELTSRLDSWKIPGLLKKLDSSFPRGDANWPVDVLLATNMISVGVDIDRLGLMVVTGQPKTTAEYIQATSRVGRKYPGLVVTMYNWLGARDLSHYERFYSYHAALYRYVESISVTPFSSRALDRGLKGILVSMIRLTTPGMELEKEAENFNKDKEEIERVIKYLYDRASSLVGKKNAELVQRRLLSYSDDWAHLADDLLRYTWLHDSQRPPKNSRVLIRTAGTTNEGEWSTPGSLREVEPTASFSLLNPDKESKATSVIGDVRPSQVITTFGPGAIVDLQTLSVVVAGIDHWPTHDAKPIHESRLEKILKVSKFLPARQSQDNRAFKKGTVPTFLFPRYQLCPACRTLSEPRENYLEYDLKQKSLLCKAPECEGREKRRATTIPAPFIVACPSGHMDDFPWRRYVHDGQNTCKKKMSLISIAKTGSVADLLVRCKCGKQKNIGNAFGEKQADAIGPCTKHRPWLGSSDMDSACKHENQVRVLQRGATNAWFPVVRSALVVRETATPIGQAIRACDPKQIDKIDTQDTLKQLIEMKMFPSLLPFKVDEIWEKLKKLRGDIPADDVDLRWPEWNAFRESANHTTDKHELCLEDGEVPKKLNRFISRVVLARKLLEIRVLTGFTRIDPIGGPSEDEARMDIAPIFRKRSDWLPGIEVRGEGIFIEFNEGALTKWENGKDVQQRTSAMEEKYVEWEKQRGAEQTNFPGPRYVLLHSFAHSMIRQLALDCGYSASSVRERIYCCNESKRKMAGVLLYTASSDSEGSLGGLVDLGSPNRFPQLVYSALRSAQKCSSDPLCADHKPDVHATINGAACHACILASETSCESFNRFLDRNFLVPTFAYESLSFFSNLGIGK